MIHLLYFNGLGSGSTRWREKLAMRYLLKQGIEVRHIQVNWYANEPFGTILDRVTLLVKKDLEKHGKVVLVGSSAGGSLVVNILGRIPDKNLSAVTLCSRLSLANLPWWDRRSLERMAYLGRSKESKLFFDSVTYCSHITIPKLTKTDKRRLLIIQQWMDDVVPRVTMSIKGVRVHKVPGFGHGWGIAMAVRQLPRLLSK